MCGSLIVDTAVALLPGIAAAETEDTTANAVAAAGIEFFIVGGSLKKVFSGLDVGR